MFTDCPGCARQFRIRAVQLSAARGQVKCGYCAMQFSALEHLRDEPLPAQALPAAGAGKKQQIKAGPAAAVKTAHGASKQHEHEQKKLPFAEAASTSDADNAAAVETGPDYVLLEDLLEPEAERSGWLVRLCWSGLSLSLLLIAVVQLAWFNRDQVLSRYPELMPHARQLCERVQCELIRYRNVGAIRLLNRDVRDHPRYEGALLVNLTLVNQARLIQPFPRIQLGLFDTAGKLLAHREFSASDYLDESIDMAYGMVPEQAIHIVLELVGPTENAVGFEFRFL